MLIWLVFFLWWHWPPQPQPVLYVNNGFLFVLFLLIGWTIYGAPIR